MSGIDRARFSIFRPFLVGERKSQKFEKQLKTRRINQPTKKRTNEFLTPGKREELASHNYLQAATDATQTKATNLSNERASERVNQPTTSGEAKNESTRDREENEKRREEHRKDERENPAEKSPNVFRIRGVRAKVFSHFGHLPFFGHWLLAALTFYAQYPLLIFRRNSHSFPSFSLGLSIFSESARLPKSQSIKDHVSVACMRAPVCMYTCMLHIYVFRVSQT